MLAGLARDLARGAGVEIDLPHEKVSRLGLEELMEEVLQTLRGADLVQREVGLPWLRRYLRGVTARLLAMKEYRPEPYAGRVTLFRSTEAQRETAQDWLAAGVDTTSDPDLGWGRLSLLPLERNDIPGHHVTIMEEPQVSALAERLRACIETALREKGR